MPLTFSKGWLYPAFIMLAVIFYFAAQNADYPHADSSYLNARYAHHLVEGQGFVYNPDEKILLTWSPLRVLTQAAVSLPAGEVKNPPELLLLVMIGIGAAALIRLFLREGWQWGAVLAAGIFLTASFGGAGWWLAAFSLVALDFASMRRWPLAALTAGLMVLISPLALIFILLLGVQAIREKQSYWRWVAWPALLWYGFALWYFENLRGLELVPPVETPLSTPILLVLGIGVIFWNFRYPMLPFLIQIFMVWAVSYGLLVLLIAEPDSPQYADVPEQVGSSVGYWGDDKQAFDIEGAAYQMEGKRDPHLADLLQTGSFEDVLLATAPDFLLPENKNFTLPTSAPVQLLNYREENGIWRRDSEVFPWQEAREVNLDFGPDMLLKTVTVDRTRVEAGGLLRLRLDWELKNGYTPVYDVLFILQLLNPQEAVLSGIEQTYSPKSWNFLKKTTYHVVPISDEAQPGLYDVLLIVGYNGGTLARHVLTNVKLPAPTEAPFADPALANFDNRAELMQANITREGDNLLVNLVWRAQSEFEADYTVFVHLTPVNDVQPVAQGDAPPVYGTLLWEKGEVIEDTHTLSLENVPSGLYVVRVGFYHAERGRIPLVEGGDSLVIGEVEK